MGVMLCRMMIWGVIPAIFAATGASAFAEAGIEPRPISFEPEPVGKLHPKLKWMRSKRIRALWVGDNFYDKYGTTDKSKAQVIAEGGFNVAVKTMGVDTENRSTAPGFEDVLPANIKEVRKHGLALWIQWNYGTGLQDPYHRYRAPNGKLAAKTCCPLDAQYIDRHVGRWAFKIAKAGADGLILDTEMYESDLSDYQGPCVCGYCFRAYLDAFARKGDTVYKSVPPQDRGTWLRDHGIYGHYSLFAARRTEDLYDGIRARCQAVNPAFILGYASVLEHGPGMTRGFGTSSVPCVIFEESEYSTGPTATMQRNLDYITRARLPAMYVCGLWVAKTSPEQMAERGLIASLYADGWWAWYGTALLTEPNAKKGAFTKEPYGRFAATPADSYWASLAPMHARLEKLLVGPKDAWPRYPGPANMSPPPTGKMLTRKGDITIDGALDELAWKSASRFEMFHDRHNKKKGPENIFWFCRDGDALYFAARCPIPAATKLSVENRGRDHPYAWMNDGLELFLDPTGTGARYAQIIISPLGDLYDSRLDFSPGSAQFGNLDWNPPTQVAAAQTEAEYVIEARIPFDDLLPAPRAGDKWGVNVCRATPAVQTWSPTFGPFHIPSRFGVMSFAVWPPPARAGAASELDMQPIKKKPEPLNRLHSKLRWMTKEKIRGIWIGDNLFDKYPGSEKTKGQVLVDAGFNLVRIAMRVNTSDTPSGVVDKTKPLDVRHDRSKSTNLETLLAPNLKEARRAGIALMIGFQFGTHHLEPYRKYRSFKEGLAKITCCPLEETYIPGQHVGKWAVMLAEGGADGMTLDMEMYHSDKSNYPGPCVCDECFKIYLKQYARNWKTVYDKVPAEGRAPWLTGQKAADHYAAFAAKRIEAMYDSIRRRCQEINPTFFFGIAPMLHHLPGVERGLGTASVPCLVWDEHEYQHGPYRGSFIGTQHIHQNLPALFVSGAYVAVQPPEMMAKNVLQSCLYTDGWWPWYGTALLNNPGAGEASLKPYGRVKGTSARDYLDRITASHAKLDELLALPKDQWPPREDGKLNWLKKRLSEVKDAKTRAEIKADLDKYMGYVRMGGY